MPYELNFCVILNKFDAGLERQVSGLPDRIAIYTAAYGRKGDALQAFPASQMEAVLIG